MANGEIKPQNGNGHNKLLVWILAGVGAGLVAIGTFGANLISRSMDLQERSIQVTSEFKTALERNTDAVNDNAAFNQKQSQWLEQLVKMQDAGFWRFFKYGDPQEMKP